MTCTAVGLRVVNRMFEQLSYQRSLLGGDESMTPMTRGESSTSCLRFNHDKLSRTSLADNPSAVGKDWPVVGSNHETRPQSIPNATDMPGRAGVDASALTRNVNGGRVTVTVTSLPRNSTRTT